MTGTALPTQTGSLIPLSGWPRCGSISVAWPKEKALAYLREQAGRHFDPRVVEVFLQMPEPE